eukprot:1570547-Amphidinium_carterae.1
MPIYFAQMIEIKIDRAFPEAKCSHFWLVLICTQVQILSDILPRNQNGPGNTGGISQKRPKAGIGKWWTQDA